MNSFWIAQNVVKRMLKEKSSFAFLALLPVIAGVIVVVIAPNSGPQPLTVGVVNGQADDQVISALVEMGSYQLDLMAESEMINAVEDKRVDVGIVFAQNSEKVRIVAMEDRMEIQALAGIINGLVAADVAGEPLPEFPKTTDTSAYDRPRMAIGFISLFMLLFIGSGIGLLLEDKKGKTFMRTFCAPVQGYQVVLGNLGANLVLGAAQIILFLLITTFVLDIQWGTGLINVFLLLFGFLIAAIGLGIGLSGFVQDSQNYTAVLSLVATPTTLLGGGFFPMEMLPEMLQKISVFVPQRWVMKAFEQMYFEEVGVIGASTSMLIILLFGAVLFTFGVKTLKPSTADM